MTYITKPINHHPRLETNKLGLTRRDYEGAVSTLCAGCGHDSISAAIVEACFQLSIEAYRVAKLSGIGCSSKAPAYFLNQSHGFNSVHGRMPSVATGANAANRDLTYIGISGDGDSLSIGMGQFAHVIRRNLDMTYIIENNGVYGLTKGQYSASADIGSKKKKGPANQQKPIDPVSMGIALGSTYVARGFSGDKEQLVPLIKGAISHKGFGLLDIISPCVTFNDNPESTKSYSHVRKSQNEVVDADFVPPAEEILTKYKEGEAMPVSLHDGSKIVFRKVDKNYDPTSRAGAYSYLRESQAKQEIITGLLYIDKEADDMHESSGSSSIPLSEISYEELGPGKKELAKIPIFGFLYKRAVIMVDRSSSKSRYGVYGKADEVIEKGYNLCIFPEKNYLDETLLLNLFKQGRLPVDKLIDGKITFDDLNEGFDKLSKGEVVRQILMPNA